MYGRVFMLTLFVLLALCIAALAFAIVCEWKLFVKADEAGWKCLIPVLAPYTLTCIATENKKIRIFSLVSNILLVIASLFSPMAGILSSGKFVSSMNIFSLGLLTDFLCAVIILGGVAAAVVNALSNYLLVTAFDESRGLAVGCVLAPYIVYIVLAFDDEVEYGGAIV